MATVSFVMYVHLSVRMEQLGFHWMFYEILYVVQPKSSRNLNAAA
jgi:hypothetical protein